MANLFWMTQFILAIPSEGLSTLKDSIIHKHDLVYIKGELPSAYNLSLENSAKYYLFSTDVTPLNVLLFFPSTDPFLPLHAQFLVPFNLTYMRFSQLTNLLKYLHLET